MMYEVHEGQDYIALLADGETTDRPSAMFYDRALSDRVATLLNGVGQQLVARIKRSSKYWGQTAPNAWFEVRAVHDSYYQLRGNSNNYRIADVAFGVRVADDTIMDLTNGKLFKGES